MLHIKDFVGALSEKNIEEITIEPLVKDLLFVPPSMKSRELLLKMQVSRVHMALVVDEYGGTDGLLTIENLIEEIVGEIEDEHDPTDADEIIQVSKNEFIADARLELSVFEKKFDKNFDDINAETLGGLFIYKLGQIPKVGDRIEIENMLLAVTAADKRKVKKIGITVKT